MTEKKFEKRVAKYVNEAIANGELRALVKIGTPRGVYIYTNVLGTGRFCGPVGDPEKCKDPDRYRKLKDLPDSFQILSVELEL